MISDCPTWEFLSVVLGAGDISIGVEGAFVEPGHVSAVVAADGWLLLIAVVALLLLVVRDGLVLLVVPHLLLHIAHRLSMRVHEARVLLLIHAKARQSPTATSTHALLETGIRVAKVTQRVVELLGLVELLLLLLLLLLWEHRSLVGDLSWLLLLVGVSIG